MERLLILIIIPWEINKSFNKFYLQILSQIYLKRICDYWTVFKGDKKHNDGMKTVLKSQQHNRIPNNVQLLFRDFNLFGFFVHISLPKLVARQMLKTIPLPHLFPHCCICFRSTQGITLTSGISVSLSLSSSSRLSSSSVGLLSALWSMVHCRWQFMKPLQKCKF